MKYMFALQKVWQEFKYMFALQKVWQEVYACIIILLNADFVLLNADFVIDCAFDGTVFGRFPHTPILFMILNGMNFPCFFLCLNDILGPGLNDL